MRAGVPDPAPAAHPGPAHTATPTPSPSCGGGRTLGTPYAQPRAAPQVRDTAAPLHPQGQSTVRCLRVHRGNQVPRRAGQATLLSQGPSSSGTAGPAPLPRPCTSPGALDYPLRGDTVAHGSSEPQVFPETPLVRAQGQGHRPAKPCWRRARCRRCCFREEPPCTSERSPAPGVPNAPGPQAPSVGARACTHPGALPQGKLTCSTLPGGPRQLLPRLGPSSVEAALWASRTLPSHPPLPLSPSPQGRPRPSPDPTALTGPARGAAAAPQKLWLGCLQAAGGSGSGSC